MQTCNLAFTKELNPLAHRLYEDLIKAGVACAELDSGYQVANFSGKECGKSEEKSCIRGKGDGVIQQEEPFHFAFENYNKYRSLLEGMFKRKIPWTFDDKDPSTRFDDELRSKLKKNIENLKEVAVRGGLKPGTPKFDRYLANFLLQATTYPAGEFRKLMVEVLKKTEDPELKERASMHMKAYADIAELLYVYFDDDRLVERTALEAARDKKGKCTETSKILYSLLELAGYAPSFVYLEPQFEPALQIRGYERTNNKHLAVGIKIEDGMEILDSIFFENSDAPNSPTKYQHPMPISLRQYFSIDLINTKNSDKELLNTALMVDPSSVDAHMGMAVLMIQNGDLAGAARHLSAVQKLSPKVKIKDGYWMYEKWHTDPKLTSVVEAFKEDFEDLFPGMAELFFVVSYMYWLDENPGEAANSLDALLNFMRPTKKPSEPAIKFFEERIALFPEEMKKDEGIAARIKLIRARLGVEKTK